MNGDALKPCIVIGAGRSGTNMLRDLICSYPGISTWPCDEINYIWRKGNRSYPSDEFPTSLATDSTARYIHNAFSNQIKKTNANVLIEKTCANSLRMDFVRAIFPEAKYIIIIRDGRHVVKSAIKRWQAPLDIRYIAQKARFVPPSDIPYYAIRYAVHRAKKILSPDDSLPMWGPIYKEMYEHSKAYNVEELCAEQWISCVNSTLASVQKIEKKRTCIVSYESLQQHPTTEVERVLRFVTGNHQIDNEMVSLLSGTIKRKTEKDSETKLNLRLDLEGRFNSLLERLGYVP